MKQTIIKEQLEELTDKQIRALAKWKGLEEFDETSVKVWRKSTGVYGGDNLLLSIGQMIEFLDEKGELFDETYENGDVKYFGWQWRSEELADALWEAVKEVLETEV